jgi:EAL domain-containing protein (putative c-di-GMP-specific phosphodiesterase class I)
LNAKDNNPKELFNSISTEYQPIVELSTRSVYGYEALARFWVGEVFVAPNVVFGAISDDKELNNLEIQIKLSQIKDRPIGKKLFLNIHPHLIQSKNGQSFWKDFFNHQENIVAEIVESNKGISVPSSFIKSLLGIGVPCAIDDFLCDNAFFCSIAFIDATLVKLDRAFLERAKEYPPYRAFIKGIVSFCVKSEKVLILEGVETEDELQIAEECGIKYVQGFFFRKHFIYSNPFPFGDSARMIKREVINE